MAHVKGNFVCMFAIILFYQCFAAKGGNFIKTIKKFVSEYVDNKTLSASNLETVAQNIKQEILKMKFILLWYGNDDEPEVFTKLGQARKIFVDRLCPVVNCFVTTNKKLFKSVADFDVVIFYGPQIVDGYIPLPETRSPHQKYVFMSKESADNYPVCNMNFTDYFNWTWTYKLDSDEYNGYIIIRDKEGAIIGPKKDMKWKQLEDMEPINESLKSKLNSKIFAAAALYNSKFEPFSNRHKFLKLIKKELNKLGLTLDVYGLCGTKNCPGLTIDTCWAAIERNYFFYFAFEDSFSEDYVTDQLLYALNHYTVPVVYGAANYSRFMPHGVYLNALALGPKNLVKRMVELMSDRDKYYNLFRWHNHYSYHSVDENPETDPICRMCKKINSEKEIGNTTVLRNFKLWWMSIHYREDVCIRNLNDQYA